MNKKRSALIIVSIALAALAVATGLFVFPRSTTVQDPTSYTNPNSYPSFDYSVADEQEIILTPEDFPEYEEFSGLETEPSFSLDEQLNDAEESTSQISQINANTGELGGQALRPPGSEAYYGLVIQSSSVKSQLGKNLSAYTVNNCDIITVAVGQGPNFEPFDQTYGFAAYAKLLANNRIQTSIGDIQSNGVVRNPVYYDNDEGVYNLNFSPNLNTNAQANYDAVVVYAGGRINANLEPGDEIAVIGMTCRLADRATSQTYDYHAFYGASIVVTDYTGTEVPVDKLQPVNVYRYYNPFTGVHFYTAGEKENSQMQRFPEFNYEKVAFKAFLKDPGDQSGLESVHRFYNYEVRSHLYTYKQDQISSLIKGYPQFLHEGQKFFAYSRKPGGLIAVERFYNPSTLAHFFTSNKKDFDNVRKNFSQFKYESTAFYVLPADYEPVLPTEYSTCQQHPALRQYLNQNGNTQLINVFFFTRQGRNAVKANAKASEIDITYVNPNLPYFRGELTLAGFEKFCNDSRVESFGYYPTSE